MTPAHAIPETTTTTVTTTDTTTTTTFTTTSSAAANTTTTTTITGIHSAQPKPETTTTGYKWLLLGWVTVCGQVKHLSI